MNHDITLQHSSVTLRPLAASDASTFRTLVDRDAWAGMSVPLPATDEAMTEHLTSLIDDPAGLAFAVEQSGHLVGITTFYGLVDRLRVEIGHTIYARSAWGSSVNPAAKLLLFGYAFETLAVGRVALRCDHRNSRSHRAIERLGARFEGTLRRFRLAADGTIADVDYFSVLRDEWPAVRKGLTARLAMAG